MPYTGEVWKRCWLAILTAVAAAQIRYDRAQVDTLLHGCDEHIERFVAAVDRVVDRTRTDGSGRDRLQPPLQRLKRELARLRKDFDRRENYLDLTPRVEVALKAARELHLTVSRRKMSDESEMWWGRVISDLNQIASAYGLAKLRQTETNQ